MSQPTLVRLLKPHEPYQRKHTTSGTRSSLSSIATLTWWQLRQTWPLLFVIGLGLLLAVVLVGAIPLYGRVSTSAGLRHALEAEPQNQYITVNTESQNFSTDTLKSTQSLLTQVIQADMGKAVLPSPALSVQIPTITAAPDLYIQAVGEDVSHAQSHVKLLAGRLPVTDSGTVLEFAATRQAAQALHVKLGGTFSAPYTLSNQLNNRMLAVNLTFRLVGIIAQTNANDLFWHGETFLEQSYFVGISQVLDYPLLVSNTEISTILQNISLNSPSGYELNTAAQVSWYYAVDLSQLDTDHLPALTKGLNTVLTTLSQYPQEAPSIENTTSLGPLNVLQDYSVRETVTSLPILCLTFLIGALVLFFVVLLTDVLVERQMTAITLLRSRGATARQVFGSLVGQSLGLGVLAFVIGPLLAILLIEVIATMTLTANERGALNLVTNNLLVTAQGLTERDLLVVGIAILGMVLSTWRVLRGNILVLRGESTRSTRQPLWKRLKLDFLAAALALVGFGFSFYIESGNVLDVRTRTLILPLTVVIGVLFLLVSCLLLFLRLFPTILRLGEQMAGRNRGAAPLLALAQMARVPRQSLRMTLLFALAVAFTLFTLIFQATQAQRLLDLTTYQVGSDFSGIIPDVLQANDWGTLKTYYSGIKGISSATLGYSENVSGGSEGGTSISLEAVDSSTYARTIAWKTQYSSQPLATLTSSLQVRQSEAEQKNIIPAIIDDAAAQSLNIGVGQQFVLSDFHGPMDFTVVAIVHYIPTIYDTTSGTEADTSIPQGGVLVDFQTYSDIALAVNENGVSASNVWLRAYDDPTDLASARSTLFNGTYALTSGEDQRVLAANLATDPLYGAIIGILVIGALTALLLGIGGNLLVSWLNARSRKTSFAILRALGCPPQQVVGILLWEQGIVYTIGLLLGVILSIVFALIMLPAFVFSPASETAIGGAELFYVAQSVPAVQVVIPIAALVGVVVGVAVLCILALGIMVRVVARPQMNQELRLSED